MFCIKCGRKIPDDSEFCQFCGSTLVPQAAEPVQPAAPVTVKKEKKQKFCKECGSPIDSESNKCTGCGKQYFKIKGKPKEKTKEKAEKKPFKFKWWYAAVAVAVLLVGYVAVNYIGAVSAMNNGKFVKSKQFFDNLLIGESVFADKYEFVTIGAFAEEENYLEALELAKSSKSSYVTSSVLNELKEKLYVQAQTSYRKGIAAYIVTKRFEALGGYKRSTDYLKLLDSYDSCEKLYSLIGFENAEEKILKSGLRDYLLDRWETSDGNYYFELYEETYEEEVTFAGEIHKIPHTTYPTTYSLPHKDASGYYYLNNGIYSVGETEASATKYFKFDLIDADTMNVYCYKDGSTHKMYRQ